MVTRIQFNREMDELNKDITEMAANARNSIDKAVHLIMSGEYYLKDEVKRLDEEIYEQDRRIEARCMDIIALYTPVASDLRYIATCLKVIEHLNRIGRYARDISEVAEVFEENRPFKRMSAIPQMAHLVVGMVTDAIDCFVNRDTYQARRLFDRDDEVDALYDTIFRDTLTYMMEDSKKITVGINVILVARYLERIADHSCDIGEKVNYMVTGERFTPPKKEQRDQLKSVLPEDVVLHEFHQDELREK
ncbi:MAG: phosphate signaling complex protein PhoU [Methanomassiliicoccales archaeon]